MNKCLKPMVITSFFKSVTFLFKTTVSIVLLTIVSTLLSGCWDRIEINDVAFVLATAVDRTEKGEVRLCVEVPLAGQIGGASGGGGGTVDNKPYYIDWETGNTSREALSKLQRRMSRQLYFAHRRVLLIGESLARDGIGPPFDTISRARENRLSTQMVVVKGDACKVLQARSKLERFTGEAVRELIKMQNPSYDDMREIAIDMTTDGKDAIIPLIQLRKINAEEESEQVELAGYALFHKDKMVGIAEGNAALGLIWSKPVVKTFTENLDSRQGSLSVSVDSANMEIKPILSRNNLRFHISINAVISILEDQSHRDYSQHHDVLEVELLMNKHIRERVQSIIRMMKELRIDPIGSGTMLYRHYPDSWINHYSKQWRERLKDIPFEIEVHTRLQKSGMTSNNILDPGGIK